MPTASDIDYDYTFYSEKLTDYGAYRQLQETYLQTSKCCNASKRANVTFSIVEEFSWWRLNGKVWHWMISDSSHSDSTGVHLHLKQMGTSGDDNTGALQRGDFADRNARWHLLVKLK